MIIAKQRKENKTKMAAIIPQEKIGSMFFKYPKRTSVDIKEPTHTPMSLKERALPIDSFIV